MSASLVGSEMCIRDSHPDLLKAARSLALNVNRQSSTNTDRLRRVMCVHSPAQGASVGWATWR
eukprot:7356777-Alexandrium_andersonii.AAC.1